MPVLSFDHVHIVSRHPELAARWYRDTLGGEIVESKHMLGAPQIYVKFGTSMIVIRGQRPNEMDLSERRSHGIVDHFAFRVDRDFEGFCARLMAHGVDFTMQPCALDESTSVAFITAPDGISIELMHRAVAPQPG
ncbi:VOC family protein [Celeribacter indicus]|uniref:Putative glyoxalase n=1 Tax=Celeribacter indicus TaxID=1208324 RepID=A0A0B5E183_9RHOB|nr:VOC family protein [Celeribacter indicus]AJE46776.1 putative glyoxalase [Celeribacter indicus]SDX06133.1 Catechol 2,3-dioxygenase [Celeribacter indicus]